MWFSQVIETIGALHYPPCDLYETEDSLTLVAELPGLSVKDLRLEIQDNILTISGEKKVKYLDSKPQFHLSERLTLPFKRSFALAKQVDPACILASFKDGILKVNIQKKEVSQIKTITIEKYK